MGGGSGAANNTNAAMTGHHIHTNSVNINNNSNNNIQGSNTNHLPLKGEKLH